MVHAVSKSAKGQPSTTNPPPSESVLERMRRENRFDIALYEWARKRESEQIAAYDELVLLRARSTDTAPSQDGDGSQKRRRRLHTRRR